MRICYVFQDEYPWDIRVEKFVDTFAAGGHQTVIVSRNRSGLVRREVLRPGITVRRLPQSSSAFARNLMNFPAFFSPWWVHEIITAVRREQLDLLIVRDLPLAAAAVLAARATGRPVLLDMAENYPAMLQATWDLRGPRPLDYLVRNPALLRILERLVLPKLSGIFVVSRPSRDRVVKLTRGSIPVWIVGNTPRLERAAQAVPSALADRLAAHSGLVLLYVGHMDAKRGLETVVRALPLIKQREPAVLAVFVGCGEMEGRIKHLAEELRVTDNLLLPGWVDQREIPSIIRSSDIGLIPHLVTEHTNTTIPNKIYDYMAQARPVLATQCLTLREIVETSGCGLIYTDRDPESLATAVLESLGDGARVRMGDAGRRAVEETYNWSHDAQVLKDALVKAAGRQEPLPVHV
jgi:glycosyltransferase involved in cell wall biosynthesis